MLLCEFSALSRTRQIDALFDTGIRLCSRQDEHYSRVLYGVSNFYVEVLYNRKKKHISHLRAFNSVNLLDPYLEHINITPLLL